MNAAEAIIIVARHLAAEAIAKVSDDAWENYGEVGEADWERIDYEARLLVTLPSEAEMHEAFAVLAARANLAESE